MENNSFLQNLPKIDTQLPPTIDSCHELIKALYKTTTELFKRIEKLEAENRELKERLSLNSSNSSLPPSKDFKKKKKGKDQPESKNKGGGQKGHPGHFRELLDPREVDQILKCKLPKHCICGGQINRAKDYQAHQVHELPEIKLHVTEYRLEKGCCTACGTNQVASLPKGVTWGITGPKLTAFMTDLVSKYQLSRREAQEFLKEHLKFKISLGTIFAKQKLVNAALEEPVQTLLETVKQSPVVNMDETGHKRDGKNQWVWGIFSSTVAFFSIATSRGKKVLKDLMGDFQAVVISDRYTAYQHFDSSNRQICWAHLKRDFIRLSEKKDPIIRRIGKSLLQEQEGIFKIWRMFKEGQISRYELMIGIKPIRKRLGLKF